MSGVPGFNPYKLYKPTRAPELDFIKHALERMFCSFISERVPFVVHNFHPNRLHNVADRRHPRSSGCPRVGRYVRARFCLVKQRYLGYTQLSHTRSHTPLPPPPL